MLVVKVGCVEKTRPTFLSFTNMYILGYCGKQAFLYLEILNRMSGLFQRMWFFP